MLAVNVTEPGAIWLYNAPFAAAPTPVPVVDSTPVERHVLVVSLGGWQEVELIAVTFVEPAKKFTPGAPTPKLKNFTMAPFSGAVMFWIPFLSHAAMAVTHAMSASEANAVNLFVMSVGPDYG